MTRDILQTDIDLATRLMANHRPDDEIILALAHRGVELGPAAQLVDELRSGRKVTPHSTVHLEFGLGRRARAKSASRGTGQNPPAPSTPAESRREPPTRPAMQGRKSPAVLWLIAAALVGLGIVVGSIVLFQRYHAKTNGQEEQQPKPALPKTNSAPHKAPAPAAPAKSP
jgi:hypothetical protein